MTLVKLPEIGTAPSKMQYNNGYDSMSARGAKSRAPQVPSDGSRSSRGITKRVSDVDTSLTKPHMRTSSTLLGAAQSVDNERRVDPRKKSRPGVEPMKEAFIPTLNRTKVELADEIFILLDVNKDGQIDSHEWTQFLGVVAQNAPELAGALNPRAPQSQQGGENEAMAEAFGAADVDGSAGVDKDEWNAYIKGLVDVIGLRKWKKSARAIFDTLTTMEANGSLIAPHRVLYNSKAITKNALAWLEPDDSDWLKPDADSAVSFSPLEITLLKKYFKMRDTDGSESLSWSELDHVMEDIGRKPPPNTEDSQILLQLTEYADKNKDGCLNFDEFIGFLAAYCHALYERVFGAFDADGTGTISLDELENVLKVLAKAGFEVSWDSVSELVSRVDSDGNGTLDFSEFCHLMHAYRMIEFEHLKSCSGFPIRRVDGLKHLFDSVDADGSGSLGAREVAALLEKTSLGRALDTREDLHAFSCLFKRMDRDQSSTLEFEEFLRLLKVWSGGGHVKECDERALTDVQEKARYEKFGEMKEAVLDGWAEEFEHDMEDGHLSQTWGVPEDEVRTMRDCFEFTDVNGSGKIQSSELLPFMESVGHKVKAGKMKEALDMTIKGRDMADGLDFAEAVEVVCMFEKNLSVSALGGEDQKVKRGALLSSLYAIGMFITPKAAEPLFEQASVDDTMVDCNGFMRVLRALRSQHMSRWCENCGFKQKDVDKFGSAFTDMLAGSGNSECELKLEKVRELLYKFNLVGNTAAEKSKMLRAISRVDRDNSGTMSFEEFLLLVRNFRNKEMYIHTLENEDAILRHGLDSESGELLKKLFNEKDTEDIFQISQEDVVSMFKDLGIARKEAQQEKVRERISLWSTKEQERKWEMGISVGDIELSVSFPQFLDILKEIEKQGEL